jgi:predicted O-methyltransferase YrrM
MARSRFRTQFFPDEINRLGFKIGVEVGVYDGDFSDLLLAKSNLSVLYSVDIWKDMAGDPMTTILDKCRTRLSRFGDRSVVVVSDSTEASRRFEDNSIDFVYIDADHSYDGVTADLTAWYPKVRLGGMMSGHDYKNHSTNMQPMGTGLKQKGSMRVLDAVTDFVRVHPHEVGRVRGVAPSWWFIK